MKEICKYCCHWKKGRCQKTKYNTDMLYGKGELLGIKTSWNHYCSSGDFVQRKGENK